MPVLRGRGLCECAGLGRPTMTYGATGDDVGNDSNGAMGDDDYVDGDGATGDNDKDDGDGAMGDNDDDDDDGDGLCRR